MALKQVQGKQINTNLTGSFSGSFSGTFLGSGAGLTNIPASGITGLNLSQISSGSVSASISEQNGLQVNTNVAATSFTGSLFGTASNSTSASYVTGSIFTSVNPALSASYAATASSATNFFISGGLTSVDYIDFDTTATTTQPTVGRLSWNDVDGTLDLGLKGNNVTLQVGQESVLRVVNKTSTNTNLLQSNYQIVRLTGVQGQRLKIDLAQATNDLLSAETIGLVTETINNNQEGFITTSGLVRQINTTGTLQGETWANGDILYLSPTTPGAATNIKPIAPNHMVIVGYVVYSHNSNGSIFVKVDNGYEIDELHNVLINTGSITSGQLLVKSGSVWINSKQLTGSYAITGSLNVTQGITGSLFGTATTASHAPSYLPLTGGTIAGSLVIQNNLTVLGSASIQHISESVLNIGTNTITVNTFDPAVRFGGLSVIDSGSSPVTSASLLYDSLQDEFIFVHKGTSTSAITSSHFVLGPETYNNLGDEIYLSQNRIPKSVGNEHLNDSNITDSGTVVSINSNTQVTGSLTATQRILAPSFTGSLLGTSSRALVANSINISDNTSYGGSTFYPVFSVNTSGITTLNVDSQTFTYNPETNILTTTASNAILASHALTASHAPSYLPLTGGTLTGDLNIVRTAATLNLTSTTAGPATINLTANSTGGGDAIIDTLTTQGGSGDLVIKAVGTERIRIKGNTPAVIITGSLTVTQGITGSLQGTASNAISSSHALTASYVTGSIFTSANPALSASYALTASHVIGGNIVPTLQQVTTQGATTDSSIIIESTGGTAITINRCDQSSGILINNPYPTYELGTPFQITAYQGEDNPPYEVFSIGSYGHVNAYAIDALTTVQAHQFVKNGGLASQFLMADGSVTSGSSGAAFPFTGSARITGSLNVIGPVIITGSLNVTQGITGSLFGTASQSVSSSYALTASYALNGGGGASFPYTGSAQITGSLIITGSTTSTQGFIKPGAGAVYLLADGSTTAGTGGSPFPFTGNAQITGSLQVQGSATFTGPISASDYQTTWSDFSSLSTVVGWSSTTRKVVRYMSIGKLAIVEYDIFGTSNSATVATFTIPFTASGLQVTQSNNNQCFNGSTVPSGQAAVASGSSLVVCNYYGTAIAFGTGWSGNKGVRGVLTLEIT